MAIQTPKYRATPRNAAFTLIEILVVISIIVALTAIAVPVAFKALADAEIKSTQSLLTGLESAADSYNIETKTLVQHRPIERDGSAVTDAFGNTIDLNIGQDDDRTLAYFVLNAGQVTETAQLIAIAAKKNLTLNGTPMLNIAEDIQGLTVADLDSIQLVDAWDNPIRYAAGVVHNNPADTSDREIVTLNDGSQAYGNYPDDDYLPEYPTAYFASAGPDGLWGAVIFRTNEPDPSEDGDGDGVPDAQDNIYSFELD